MDGSISRQAAIDEMKEHRRIFCDDTPETFSDLSYGDKCRVDEIDNAIATLINLPSAQPEQKWIPIEVRPPKFGEDVLISYRNGVCVDWLTQSEGNAYFFISGVAIQDIDAWMPLPEPYQEEK